MTESDSSSTGDMASALGWDTVFAIRTADANAAIRAHNAQASQNNPSRPVSLSQSDKEGGIMADFGDWQIVNEGGSAQIYFELPLQNVKVTMGPSDIRSFTDGTVTVAVNFQFMPPPPHPSANTPKVPGGTKHHLQIVGQAAASAASMLPSVATVQNLMLTGNTDDFLTTVASDYLATWLNANLDYFDAVLATLTLNELEDNGEFAFLRPIFTNYAYCKTDDGGLIGVLCLTEGSSTDPHTLAQQVTAVAIPLGEQCGFLISKTKLVQEMLLPLMAKNFPGSEGNYAVTPDGGGISLTSAVDCTINCLDDQGNPTSKAGSLQALELRIEGDRITLETQTQVTVSPGIHAQNLATVTRQFYLMTQSTGKQTIAFRPDPEFPDAQPLQSVIIDPWVKDAEIGAGVLAAIITAVAAAATGGAFGIAAGMAMGVLVGGATAVVAATPEWIALANTDDAPTADLLVSNINSPIIWPNSNVFRLTSAGLSDSLQLCGRFQES